MTCVSLSLFVGILGQTTTSRLTSVWRSLRGDSLRLVLDSEEGFEVHFLLEVIETVQMERKG